jgi:hypothetical protein
MTFRLSGFASTSGIDAEDCSFAHGSIVIPKAMPPLFISHKCIGEPVGKITKCEWQSGGLFAEVEVPDDLAEYKAFSIGCRLRDYEIIGLGSSAYAKVTRAIMTELSLTNSPCNSDCLITKRERINPTPVATHTTLSADEVLRNHRWNHEKIRALAASIR